MQLVALRQTEPTGDPWVAWWPFFTGVKLSTDQNAESDHFQRSIHTTSSPLSTLFLRLAMRYDRYLLTQPASLMLCHAAGDNSAGEFHGNTNAGCASF